MKSRRRVHRKKNYTKNKTRRGAGFRDIFHTITGTSSVKPYKSEPIKTYTDKELVNRFKQRLAKKMMTNFIIIYNQNWKVDKL